MDKVREDGDVKKQEQAQQQKQDEQQQQQSSQRNQPPPLKLFTCFISPCPEQCNHGFKHPEFLVCYRCPEDLQSTMPEGQQNNQDVRYFCCPLFLRPLNDCNALELRATNQGAAATTNSTSASADDTSDENDEEEEQARASMQPTSSHHLPAAPPPQPSPQQFTYATNAIPYHYLYNLQYCYNNFPYAYCGGNNYAYAAQHMPQPQHAAFFYPGTAFGGPQQQQAQQQQQPQPQPAFANRPPPFGYFAAEMLPRQV